MIDRFIADRLPPPEAQPDFLFDLPELQYPERLNAAVELIDRQDPDALAVLNDAGAWTYGEMKDLSDRIARLLVEREGLVPGNRVFLRGPNNAMLFASWLGVLKAGGVVVATMPMLRPGEIATILERARVSHAIVDARFRADFDAAGGVGSVLAYDGDNGFDGLDDVAPGFAPVDTHRDDVALIAFTSGTTGKPKGCVHYHRDVLARADSFARHVLKPRARRPLGLLGADRLHLRARHAADLPVALRRHRGDDRDAGAQAAARRDRPPQGHQSRHRAHRLQGDDPDARRARHLVASAPASPPASICPPRPGMPGRRRPASASSTASARPR